MDTPTAPPADMLTSSGVALAPAPAPSKPAPVKAPAQPAAPAKPAKTPAKDMTIDFSKAADRRSMEDKGQPKAEEPAQPATPEPEGTKATPEPGKEAPTGEPAKPSTETAKGKTAANPWKLVDAKKAEVKALRTELEQIKSKMADPEALTTINKKLEAVEARNKELESEIRFHDFSKSQEFKDQFQTPLNEAWDAARLDMAEISVTTEDGGTRQATLEDVAALANMRLQEAKTKAKEMFGDLADEVMGHRRKILELSRKQQQRLDQARKESQERIQKESLSEQEFRREVIDLDEKINAQQLKTLEFLQPKEGDAEYNERLQTAREFVEGTLRSSIKDKNLTKQQRAELVEKMITVKNRAIGFSAMKLEVKRLKAQLAEKDGIIAKFQQGEPGPGNGKKDAERVAAVDPGTKLFGAFQRAADRQSYR